MKKGFTLIELLIVIGLLAALAAILLPSMMGDRTTALEGICNYNQAGTLRTLRQFESMTSGKLPNGLHTGLETGGSSAMSGLPTVLHANMGRSGCIEALSAEEVAALNALGITKLAYGSGDSSATDPDEQIGYETVSSSVSTAIVTTDWHDDAGAEYSFNGKTLSMLEDEGYTKVIPLFITPTTDWTAQQTTAWTKGFSVGMDVPGSCPIPEGDFAYYVAYVGLKPEGAATYTASSVADGAVSTAPSPILAEAADVATMKSAIETAITNANAALTDSAWDTTFTWSDTTEEGEVVASTLSVTRTETGGTNVLETATYSVTLDTTPKGKLLGTSCPECGITNP